MFTNYLSKADLHIHTKYSYDCFTPLEKIFEMADKKNLQVIAITDHNTMKGAFEAEKIAPKFNVQLIKGEEIDTKQGHLIGLFLTEPIKSGYDILATIKEIHQQNGLAIVPHPLSFLQKGISLKILYQVANEIDGLEVLNGAQTWLVSPWRQRVIRLNQEKFGLALIGGSDAHIKDQVGMGCTFFAGRTPADLYSAIKNKSTKSRKNYHFLEILKISCKIIPTQPLRSIKLFFKHYAKL